MNDQVMGIGDVITINGTQYTKQYVACYHRLLWEDVKGGCFLKERPVGEGTITVLDHVIVIGEDDREYNGKGFTGDATPTTFGERAADGSYPLECFARDDGKIIYIAGRSYDDWNETPELFGKVNGFIAEHAPKGLQIQYEKDDGFARRL